MKSNSFVALLSAAGLLLSVEVASAQPPPPSGKADLSQENARVRELFRKGSQAFEAGKYEEARKALEEAWAIRQTYDIAASLAQVESELGHRARSAEYLAFCLQNFAPAESEQTLQEIQKAFDKVRQQIAVLSVAVNRDGAEILVGERVVGRSPLPAELFVDPGSHAVRARFEGSEASDTIIAEAGGKYTLDLVLEAAPAAAGSATAPTAPDAPPAAAPTPASPVADKGVDKSLVPVVVGGTVFVLALGSGIGFHLSANADEEQAAAIREQTGPNGCARAPGGDLSSNCRALADLAESQDRNRNLSTASFLVAGAALVATGAYWFWPRESSTRLSAAAAPGQAGVILSGTFY